ncbi:long-chain fatty acid transport protein 2-like [Saccoglossus kowalevskii]|uniref:Long-chain-fatty-acid--CoA ligase n=1 Tax=Saccoglossus kowalevskii TaxID=10224 RepID=A0ABM0LUG8_SACKO|nr:PREDICTED: very long-chain acyl-CoA synthetase-like [Saccoglossus kowalevskii]
MDDNVGYSIVATIFITIVIIRQYYPYLLFDISRLYALIFKIILPRSRYLRKNQFTVDVFSESVTRQPGKACLIHKDRVYTYSDIELRSNQFANLVAKEGYKLGDTVGIFMSNEPAYIWMWLGFVKLGIKCALLNYNLRGDCLMKCISSVDAKLIMVGEGEELRDAIEGVSNLLKENGIRVWTHGSQPCKNEEFKDITFAVENAPADPIPRYTRRDIKPSDVCSYIYTSGTTGLPKASKITYYRHLGMALIFGLFDVNADDVCYITLPLYHSSATLSWTCAIRTGATIVLAPKFSASGFWRDVRKHDVTVIYYIGELCRYLLAQPKHVDDAKNRVRIAIGNGLRPDVWIRFAKRFGIPLLGEFYGATDGNLFGYNADNKVGACGRFSPFLKKLFKFELVKYYFDKAEPVRDMNGRCIPVEQGQPGLLIVQITTNNPFDGYAGKESLSDAKRIRNAFKDGDVYFNSGDIFALDKDYYFYFMDRLGDTFRWKGENVATTEVEQIICRFPGIRESTVYGVSVPGCDGRAGMAAVVLEDEQSFDFQEFYAHLRTYLPLYACPKFLRIQDNLVTTGTFKYSKLELVKGGFDPNVVDEPMYAIHVEKKTFKPLVSSVYADIVNGKLAL